MSEVKIPDSLKPENIMETIGEREKLLERQKRRRRKKILKATVSVATGAVVLGVTGHIVLQKVREHKMDNWEWTQAPETLDNYQELYELRNEVIAYQELQDKLSWDFGWGKKDSASVSGSSSAGSAMNNMADDFYIEESIPDSEVPESENSSTENSGTEHSETNVQTEGVDESDWVKTDGEYIYHINMFYDELEIIKADGEKSELVGQYKLSKLLGCEDTVQVGEGYLVGDKFILQVDKETDYTYAVYDKTYYDYQNYNEQGWVVSLNVEDKSNVYVEGKYEYEGELVSTRIQEDTLYVVSKKDIDYTEEDTVPIAVDGAKYPAEEVLLMDIEKGTYYKNYTCVAAVDIMNELETRGAIVYAASGTPEMYMSTENIYLYSDILWSDTELVKVSLADGGVTFHTKIKIPGYFNDQFSMDEYNGYLRVVYTSTQNGNVLEIFDEDMKSVGRIDNIAHGESIYSARFQGDLGYFVTYRQVDPLYCVDLSDPTDPRILGFLKIPGYSSYLHPITEDRMFGIGYEDNYLKVSLFDVSDSEDLKEIQVIKFEECYYSEAAENHKALLVAEDNTVFGFATESYWQYNYSENSGYNYVIMNYVDDKLEIVERIAITDYSEEYTRGVQCGDYLYLLTGSGCGVYAMDAVLSEEIATEIAEVKY